MAMNPIATNLLVSISKSTSLTTHSLSVTYLTKKVLFSLERLGRMADQCAWIGGLRNSGVFINLEQSTFVYPYQAARGRRERLPVFVGSRQETDLSMDNFEEWYNEHLSGKDVE